MLNCVWSGRSNLTWGVHWCLARFHKSILIIISVSSLFFMSTNPTERNMRISGTSVNICFLTKCANPTVKIVLVMNSYILNPLSIQRHPGNQWCYTMPSKEHMQYYLTPWRGTCTLGTGNMLIYRRRNARSWRSAVALSRSESMQSGRKRRESAPEIARWAPQQNAC